MKRLLLTAGIAILTLIPAVPASAQVPEIPCEEIIASVPDSSVWEGTVPPDYLDPSDFERCQLRIAREEQFERFALRGILFFLGFLSIVMLLVLIFGGYKMIVARGEDEAYTQGKKTVMHAVVGFVIVILSYAMIVAILSSTFIGRILGPIFGG